MQRIKYLLYISPLIIFIIMTIVREYDKNNDTLGSIRNPIKILFTPSVDAKQITGTADELISFLEKETGYHYSYAIPADYVAVVEAFGSGKADVASINTFSYLMANKRYGATAGLRVVHDNNEISYKGQIITKVGSGINKPEDLEGKKIAYVDPSSTSGYILPKALLDSKGIKPAEEVFAKKHDVVVTMVYQGQVDAGACYYLSPDNKTGEAKDSRVKVLTQYPDVLEKIKIVSFTQEIPNDPFVFRKEIPSDVKQKIIDALLKFVKTEKGAKAMYEIHSLRGLIPAKDSDYDVLRSILDKMKFKY